MRQFKKKRNFQIGLVLKPIKRQVFNNFIIRIYNSNSNVENIDFWHGTHMNKCRFKTGKTAQKPE